MIDHRARVGQVRGLPHATATLCADGGACTQSGIWQPIITNGDHPLNRVYNGTLAGENWRWQVFAIKRRALPALADRLAAAQSAEGQPMNVRWQLMVLCEPGFEPFNARAVPVREPVAAFPWTPSSCRPAPTARGAAGRPGRGETAATMGRSTQGEAP